VPSLFQSILKTLRPVRRNDSVFGSMLFIGGKPGYWEGTATFAPTETRIEVFVDGSEDSDLTLQHEFFASVCDRWPELRNEIGIKLHESWIESYPEDVSNDVWNHFRISYVTVREESLESAEWDLGFETDLDDQLFAVEMKGCHALLVTVDG